MNLIALSLCITLASPGVSLLPEVLKAEPPPTPSRPGHVEQPVDRPWAPLAIIATGIGLIAGGLLGMSFDGGCPTRDADLRCTDPRGGSAVMPSLVILGLAFTVTGEHWRRTTEPREP